MSNLKCEGYRGIKSGQKGKKHSRQMQRPCSWSEHGAFRELKGQCILTQRTKASGFGW